MKARRLSDQAIVLRSIVDIRQELELNRNQSRFVVYDILQRLLNLYSLLDVKRLADVVESTDNRDQHDRRKSA